MKQELNQNQLKIINKNHNYQLYQAQNQIVKKQNTKLVSSLEQAIINVGLKDGMTISFHHHFRHGDSTVEQVLKVIDKLGIKDLKITASSLTKAHNCLIDYIKSGVVTGLESSAFRGKLGDAISEGILKQPVVIRSHGGRARAIANGETKIDVAFLAATSSDDMGNATGIFGKSICGAFGYAMVDAEYAKNVIVITDNIVAYPNKKTSINQTKVDYVVEVASIGDNTKISSGEVHEEFTLKEKMIAENIVKVITNTEHFKNGFSFQTGTGGASQASLLMLKKAMIEKQIKAGFFLGGITKGHVELLETGFVEKLLDVQSFDLDAAKSLEVNPNHIEISADFYANPLNKGCATNKLNYGILSALEIDRNFNVNVLTGADGYLRGASGGHSDVAFGSDISIVAVPLIRGRIPSVTNEIQTIVTPGKSIDVIVTENDICINPLRKDLIKQLTDAGIKLTTIEQLVEKAYKIVGKPSLIQYDTNRPIAIVEYRDGTIIDLIYQVKPFTL